MFQRLAVTNPKNDKLDRHGLNPTLQILPTTANTVGQDKILKLVVAIVWCSKVCSAKKTLTLSLRLASLEACLPKPFLEGFIVEQMMYPSLAPLES